MQAQVISARYNDGMSKRKKGKNLRAMKERLAKFEKIQPSAQSVNNDAPTETNLKVKPTGQGFRSDKPTVRKFGEK